MFDNSVSQVVLVAVVVAFSPQVSSRRCWRGGLPGRSATSAAARAGSPRATTRPGFRARAPRELRRLANSFEPDGRQSRGTAARPARLHRERRARTPGHRSTNLKGYLEALRDGVVPADAATFESLLEEADRLVRLSRSWTRWPRAMPRPTRPRAVEEDVAGAIRSAADLARPLFARAELSLAVEVPGTLPARANPDQLAQVLANLLQNALRYTPGGGRVTITASSAERTCSSR